eukprot:m.125128 g.125128  ORF g.125128 m.125128 type:complete len:66 (+) comp23449_c0_seq2:1515-1712(+)
MTLSTLSRNLHGQRFEILCIEDYFCVFKGGITVFVVHTAAFNRNQLPTPIKMLITQKKDMYSACL